MTTWNDLNVITAMILNIPIAALALRLIEADLKAISAEDALYVIYKFWPCMVLITYSFSLPILLYYGVKSFRMR